MKMQPSILVARTDRLGDMILATPVLRLLRQVYPKAKVIFLVNRAWMDLLDYGSEVEVMHFDPEESEDQLADQLRAKSLTMAFVLRDEKKVSRAVKKAGIPFRVGPFSSLRSFFLFNEGRLQSRSKCRTHEAIYNLELLKALPEIKIDRAVLPKAWIAPRRSSQQEVQDWIIKQRFDQKGFRVFHPGSSGSSRYLPIDLIEKLAQKMISSGVPLVVTGQEQDQKLLDRLVALGAYRFDPEARFGLSGLAWLYEQARVVCAHGTGPLHLAAAMGAPCFAIFPPIFVLSERRWGPLSDRSYTWVPNVKCPAYYRCIGERCAEYDCMDRFEVKVALKKIEEIENVRT